MQEVLIQVVLHKQKKFQWPIAETATHWITVGLDKDLNTAMTLAARNAVDFLASRAKLSRYHPALHPEQPHRRGIPRG